MKAVHNHEVRSLPGFRFHPTDEELVGFYLRRKVDKKPLRIDHLIREVDIYKQDPWDLPRAEIGGDNNEKGYFFCKRGRKYRNSVRPNRVTGSGFWKATGIDKPVYTQGGGGGNGHESVVGLKKTLVYYRGCAGKGTKTDWMMHEFRLPRANPTSSDRCIQHTQEAEVWTVCRIFKRYANHKQYCGDWRALPVNPTSTTERTSSKTCSGLESNNIHEGYISFSATPSYPGRRNINNMVSHTHYHVNEKNLQFCASGQSGYNNQQTPPAASSSNILSNMDDQVERFTYENWDELRSVVEFSLDSSPHVGTDTSL